MGMPFHDGAAGPKGLKILNNTVIMAADARYALQLGQTTGPITVRAYLPVDEHIEDTRHKLEESLYYLGMIQPLPAAVFNSIADQNSRRLSATSGTLKTQATIR